jgi:RND family efflux transporter MFP subunit
MKPNITKGKTTGKKGVDPVGMATRCLLASVALMAMPGCKKPETAAPPPPPLVQVMEVTKEKIQRYATFIGQLDSPQNVEVRARVESFLDQILFIEGSEVKEGDPLFVLDKKPYEEKLAAAKADVAHASAALSKGKLEVDRLTPLVASGASPEKELDTAKTMLEISEADLQSAEAKVKSAEFDLGYCEIKAPLSGRIGATQVPVGSLVGKGEPTLLATISQMDPIWFYCSISEVDYLKADRLATEAGRKMGELPVTLILADGAEHPDQGKFVFVDRVADVTTATIRARVEFPNSRQALRPGMFGRIRISLPAKEDSILIPERALTDLQGKSFVWVIDSENKARQRGIEVAEDRLGSNAIVLKGLELGERIVVEGLQKLREGAPVQPMAKEKIAVPEAKAETPSPAPAEPQPNKE